MSAPKRIQRKRTRGWRMPEGAVYVGRGSKWGNPYKAGDGWDDPFVWHLKSWSADHSQNGITTLTPAMAIELFLGDMGAVNELRGKDLVCWCPLDQPCHADVLLEWANS